MFRLTTARVASKAIFRPAVAAPASVMHYSSSEGATGSGFSRPGGAAAGDSFTKREKAAEELYVRQAEREKLAALRAKLQRQREHLDDLDKHIEEYTREHEKNDK